MKWYILYTPIDYTDSYADSFVKALGDDFEVYKPKEYHYANTTKVKSEYVYKNYMYVKCSDPYELLFVAHTFFYKPALLEVDGKIYTLTDADMVDIHEAYDRKIGKDAADLVINTLVMPIKGPFAYKKVMVVNKDDKYWYGLTSYKSHFIRLPFRYDDL